MAIDMFISDTNTPLSHEVYVFDYYVMLLQIFDIWYAVRSYGVIIIQYSVLGVAHYHLRIFVVITKHIHQNIKTRVSCHIYIYMT